MRIHLNPLMNHNMSTSNIRPLTVLVAGRSIATNVAGRCLMQQGARVYLPEGTVTRREDHKRYSFYSPDEAELRFKQSQVILTDDCLTSFAQDKVLESFQVRIVLRYGSYKSLPSNSRDYAIGHDSSLFSILDFLPSKEFDLPIASFLAGLHGANAAIMGVIQNLKGQVPLTITSDVYRSALWAQSLKHLFKGTLPRQWNPLKVACSPFMRLYDVRVGHTLYFHSGLSRHFECFLEGLSTFDKAGSDSIQSLLQSNTIRDPLSGYTTKQALKLNQVMEKLFARHSVDDWIVFLKKQGIPFGIVKPEEAADLLTKDKVFPLQYEGKALSHDRSLLPLANIGIADLSSVIAGPVAGKLLAEFGAEVFRVEPKEVKQWYFDAFRSCYHRGKYSLQIDLKDPRERKEFDNFIVKSRIRAILHNFKPGVPERLNLSGAAFEGAEYPLVWSHITAFSYGTENYCRPGYEQTVQAESGMMRRFNSSSPDLLPVPVCDLSTGIRAAFLTGIGLYKQLTMNEGGVYRTSLYENARTLLSLPRQTKTKHSIKKNHNSAAQLGESIDSGFGQRVLGKFGSEKLSFLSLSAPVTCDGFHLKLLHNTKALGQDNEKFLPKVSAEKGHRSFSSMYEGKENIFESRVAWIGLLLLLNAGKRIRERLSKLMRK